MAFSPTPWVPLTNVSCQPPNTDDPYVTSCDVGGSGVSAAQPVVALGAGLHPFVLVSSGTPGIGPRLAEAMVAAEVATLRLLAGFALGWTVRWWRGDSQC